MDRTSMERLKLDRRLIRRRGWIKPEDLDKEMEKLPDVAHKAASVEEPEPAPSAGGAAES